MVPKFKIDIHGHIMPPKWQSLKDKFGYGGFIELHYREDGTVDMVKDDGTFFRKVQANCYDHELIIKDMNEHRVNVMVLSSIPVLFYYWAKPEHTLYWCQFYNDFIADVQNEHSKRLIGLGTVPMQAPSLAIQEMERCVTKLGLKGIEIGTNVNQKNLDHPDFYPFWEAAQSLGVPIMIHPWEMMGKELIPDYFFPWLVGMPAETTRAICYMIFGGIFEKFPKLKVLFAHGGGSFFFTLGRINHGYFARPDLCAKNISKPPIHYAKSFWVDGITHDAHALKFLVDTLGADKIAYGTDYPFPLGDLEHGKFLEDTNLLTDATKEQIFWKTAFSFFNLRPADYFSFYS